MENLFAQRKAEENRLRQEGRMPPGQSLTLQFPVLHFGSVPLFDPQTWQFKIWGEVQEPVTFTWQEFERLPRTSLKLDIHCVTRWSKADTLWEGVTVQTLIQEGWLKLKPTARFAIQHAENAFSTNTTVEVVLAENFILATHFNGQPLTPDHGAPLRGVIGAIPGRDNLKTLYFWKGAKWLRGLEFRSDDQPGFWELAGYHNEGDVWKEERHQV
jgi:DMSO/TMAO reductase YedYZ molybdopterin-dependent catalytic subunit